MNRNLVYERALESEAEEIFRLVQNTVKTVYPLYYRDEIAAFFLQLHSLENIARDIQQGNVYVLRRDGVLIGTGSFEKEHITRVYIAPEFRGNGYGRIIMGQLEREIAAFSPVSRLEASLPAARFYERLGYRTVRHESMPAENGVILVYEMMEKLLQSS